MERIHNTVKEYYGKTIQRSADLRTSACCCQEEISERIKPILSLIHPEVKSRYYGCGLVIPEALEGLRVLDLGSGAGRDAFLLSRLVTEKGHVVGLDMTDQQLETARSHIEYHREVFEYQAPNVEFRKGYIERLDQADLENDSFDLVISNCVVNLSPDKESVLREAFRVLRPGGEFYFSDVYADRRIPEALQQDAVLHGECLSGALYWNDFVSLAKRAGFRDPRLVRDRRLTIEDPSIRDRVGTIRFYSATFRLFKIMELEDACEDYGQAVRYRGTLAEAPDCFVLDANHRFHAGKIEPVCGNTLMMIKTTRFAGHFDCFGDFATHHGIFKDCGVSIPFASGKDRSGAEAGCASTCC